MNILTLSEELIRKKILTLLGSDKQLISMAQVRLYTSTNETEKSQENVSQNQDEWLYSNLEGNLCYVLDFSKKTRYLRLFENTNFQLLFHMEIYQNFSNFYTAVDPLFHCFEVNNIFIGLRFSELNSANNFQLMIKKLNDQIVQMMLDSGSMKVKESRKDKKKKFSENCEILKKNFCAESKYSKEYCEDCMEICKPIFYELLNFMSYNREAKEFEVGSVPKEFRNLFKNMGIKKHMLKRADTTLNFFKYFIESLDIMEDVRSKRNICSLSDDEAEADEDYYDGYLPSEQSNYSANDCRSTMQSEKSVLSSNSHGRVSKDISGSSNSNNLKAGLLNDYNVIKDNGNSNVKTGETNSSQMSTVDFKGNVPKAPAMPGKGVIPTAPKFNLLQQNIAKVNVEVNIFLKNIYLLINFYACFIIFWKL